MTTATDLSIANSGQALSINIGKTGKFMWLFLMNFIDEDGTSKVYMPVHP